jgi:cation transport ATPase
MAAHDRVALETGSRSMSPVPTTDQPDLLLERGAMRAMLLAMLVMALGVPLHIVALGTDTLHGATRWPLVIAWLCALLTLSVFWIARAVLFGIWSAIRRRRLSQIDLVAICAAAAFAASCPALLSHAAPMYFDVAAMAIAWLLGGQAQEAAIRRRFAVTVAQLAPLNRQVPRFQSQPDLVEQRAGGLGGVLLGSVAVTLGLHLAWDRSVSGSMMVALATLAAGCPCALGIARSSAGAAGAARAAAAGWLVPSGAALRLIAEVSHEATRHAMPLGEAELPALLAIARSVRRAIRRNCLWAVGLNLALLPVAILEPVPALVPAAVMLAARWLIGITNARI